MFYEVQVCVSPCRRDITDKDSHVERGTHSWLLRNLAVCTVSIPVHVLRSSFALEKDISSLASSRIRSRFCRGKAVTALVRAGGGIPAYTRDICLSLSRKLGLAAAIPLLSSGGTRVSRHMISCRRRYLCLHITSALSLSVSLSLSPDREGTLRESHIFQLFKAKRAVST